MIPTKNNVILESVKENKLIKDNKMKLVIASKGPDVTDEYKTGDRVYLDVGVELRSIEVGKDKFLIAKDNEIISFSKK